MLVTIADHDCSFYSSQQNWEYDIDLCRKGLYLYCQDLLIQSAVYYDLRPWKWEQTINLTGTPIAPSWFVHFQTPQSFDKLKQTVELLFLRLHLIGTFSIVLWLLEVFCKYLIKGNQISREPLVLICFSICNPWDGSLSATTWRQISFWCFFFQLPMVAFCIIYTQGFPVLYLAWN